MIIDHDSKAYRRKWRRCGANRYNGAFYYSKEITRNIIPNVKTDRNWITVNVREQGADHSIVFIHNNLHPENYEWLKRYKDIVLVCGVKDTVQKVAHIGRAIYVPLSIDRAYVQQFRREKDKDVAFVGRPAKRKISGVVLPPGIDYLEGMTRQELLNQMARYKKVYAVGRCALEAIELGCEVLPYDPRYPDPSVWVPIDNKEAARILQEELDKIDSVQTDGVQDKEEVPNSEWKKAELLDYCKENNITTNSKMTKQEILDAIGEAK